MPSSDEREARPCCGAPRARAAECAPNHGTHQRHADLPIKGRPAPEAAVGTSCPIKGEHHQGPLTLTSRCVLRVVAAVTRAESQITTVLQQWKAL